jgi:hypothetical protein
MLSDLPLTLSHHLEVIHATSSAVQISTGKALAPSKPHYKRWKLHHKPYSKEDSMAKRSFHKPLTAAFFLSTPALPAKPHPSNCTPETHAESFHIRPQLTGMQHTSSHPHRCCHTTRAWHHEQSFGGPKHRNYAHIWVDMAFLFCNLDSSAGNRQVQLTHNVYRNGFIQTHT